jgi:trehalose 6-phosphate synthase/phosphatase
MAVPTRDTLEALEQLSSDPQNVVYVISGRDSQFLEQHLGHIERLGISAEHGGFIKEPGQKTWINCTESLDMSWMSEVHEIFNYYKEVSAES